MPIRRAVFALGAQWRKLEDADTQDEGLIMLQRGCALGSAEALRSGGKPSSAPKRARADERRRLQGECRAGETRILRQVPVRAYRRGR